MLYGRFPHKSKKWWKPIFYYNLQVEITNSLIIYQEIWQKKVSHLKFIEDIIKLSLGAPKKKIEKRLVYYAVLINSEKKSGERQRIKLDTCEKLTM